VTWLVRNWHLKLGAVALATVLYTGFVYSGSFTEQTFPGAPVEGINQPDSSYPLTQTLGTVDIRYRLAADANPRITPESFAVTIDLATYDMDLAPEPQAMAINVRPLADGLQILDFTPRSVAVQIDRIGEREVPVVVERGDVPEGLAIGTPQLSERTVVATGPESQLGRVERAVARVQIFESGIDVSRQVDLVPVDVNGRQVELVELNPETVLVEIDVRTVQTSKTVAVRPNLTGSVAEGFTLAGVTVAPQVVTLFGLPDALADIEEVGTQPVSIAGLTAPGSFDAELALPPDTRLASGTDPIVIAVEVVQSTSTRTLIVGVTCSGAADGLACLPGLDQIAVTVSGPSTLIAGLEAADLAPSLDVSGLQAGEYQLTPVITLPQGIELVAVSPDTVPVVLRAPATPPPTPA